MGDVKVTRAHREAALRVTWSGDVEPHDSYKAWAETGQHDVSPYSGMHDVVLELQRLARVIAEAEERGRAAERAATAALLEATDWLLTELEESPTEPHGGGHSDEDCPVCRAIAAVNEARPEVPSE